MLLSLRIENFALVDRLELDLSTGLTVLTGETGAGKSIILDALDAALGGRVTGRAVRTGADRALIEATFQLQPELQSWLEEQEIESVDEGLVCSRELTVTTGNPRSRSRVNGVVVNKQQMEALRDRLVELTAQGQTVQIGRPTLQRVWLDSYGGEELLRQRTLVAEAFNAYQQASQALVNRRRAEQDRLQQQELFEYQLRELTNANLTDGDELDQLEQEAKRLSHSVELQQQSYLVYQALYQNDNQGNACADLLGKAQDTLQDMVSIDPELKPILELVTAALTQVEEAGREMNAYGDNIEADPQRLQEVQERVAQLKLVCRRYGPTLADAIAQRDRLQTDLLELTGGGQSIQELEQALRTCESRLTQSCARLTQLRQAAATDLETRLVNELRPLAMDKVKFQVELKPCPATSVGADQVSFLFSPNPGEPMQPLAEIASGGEMSRFLLALQASFSQVDSVGTLVFDEIDVGVSGRVSQAIAEKLFHLSQHHQVLCVTHQPIVAAMADHHLRVSKHLIDSGHPLPVAPDPVNGNGHPATEQDLAVRQQPDPVPADLHLVAEDPDDIRTVVRVVPLSTEQRKLELAQLAGGQIAQDSNTPTDAVAYAFAESLLEQAATFRRSRLPLPPAADPSVPSDAEEPRPKSRSRRSKTSPK